MKKKDIEIKTKEKENLEKLIEKIELFKSQNPVENTLYDETIKSLRERITNIDKLLKNK